MEKHPYQRIGVYVDVSNIAQNGGYGMQYDILRRFACRNHGVAVRLNVYVAYDEAQAKNNIDYRQKSLSFHSVLSMILRVFNLVKASHENSIPRQNDLRLRP